MKFFVDEKHYYLLQLKVNKPVAIVNVFTALDRMRNTIGNFSNVMRFAVIYWLLINFCC